MSAQHHGGDAEQAKNLQRFRDQIAGTARREYPAGRMGAEDDGVLAYALAADPAKGVIVMRFGKPVEWVAMDLKHAERLRDMLTAKMLELRGIKSGV